MQRIFRKVLNFFLGIGVAIYIILDELIWDTLAEPIYRYIRELRILQRVEKVLGDFNRYLILVIFVILFLIVELLGLIAVKWMAQGKLLLGVGLYVGKIPIAAFTFWMFRITKEKLLLFSAFRYVHDLLFLAIERIKASELHQFLIARISLLKKWFQEHIKLKYLRVVSDWVKEIRRTLLLKNERH